MAYYHYTTDRPLEGPPRLELHYYFNDASHTMDAFVRNGCEQEFLTVIKEIIKELDIDVIVESGAYGEGGLKQFFTMVGKSAAQINLAISLTALIMTRFPPTPPVQLKTAIEIARDSVNYEKAKADLEIAQITLAELKRQNAERDAKTIFREVAHLKNNPLKDNHHITKHRGAFYKEVRDYKKITKISITIVDQDGHEMEAPNTVIRGNFSSFIEQTEETRDRKNQ